MAARNESIYRFQMANVCYISILIVGTKNVVIAVDVVLSAIAAPEATMVVCLSIRNKFHHFVQNKFISSIR